MARIHLRPGEYNYRVRYDGVYSTVEKTKDDPDEYTVFSNFHAARKEVIRILKVERQKADDAIRRMVDMRIIDL